MTTGVVTSVTPRSSGGTLSAAVSAGAFVLPLNDAADFDEEFLEQRWLVIGDETTPREYVAVANDESAQESVTLAVAVSSSYEAGLPVTPWDPTVEAEDKRAVEFLASVRLDGQDGTVGAVIPHALVPLAGVYSLEGAQVAVDEDDDGDWFVSQVFGRQAVVDPAVLDQAKLSDLIGSGGGSSQTFSADPAPSDATGYAEGHAWWQIVAEEVVGFWVVTDGAWVETAFLSGEAAYFKNAIITALAAVDLEAVKITGGSIFIAQGVAASEPQSFSGTSLPAGWTSTKVGPLGSGSPGAAVPGVSVVSSGPAGQSGSALLIDYGAAGISDSTGMASGEVYTTIGDAANAEVSTRVWASLGGTAVSPADFAYLAIRSQGGAAFDGAWDALTVDLNAYNSGFNVVMALYSWVNGGRTFLGNISVKGGASTSGQWHRVKFRTLGGQVAAKAWVDGTAEPEWEVFQQAAIAQAGRASIVWRQYPTLSASRGQDVWIDEFNVTSYVTGFTVDQAGGGAWPAVLQRGSVPSGTLTAGTPKDVAVTFPVPFGSVPEVTISPKGVTNPLNHAVCADNVTATGFTARFARSTGTASFSASWSAGPPA